jgi:heavy metal sensor kinase
MVRSFKLKMALFAAGASGVIFVAFALLFMAMIARIGLERIDRQLLALTEVQARRPPRGEHWERFDTSLANLYGEQRPRQHLVRVLDRGGAPLYESARWPQALTNERLGIRPLPPADERRGTDSRQPFDAPRPLRRGGPNEERPYPLPPLRPPRFLTQRVDGTLWRLIVTGTDALTLVVGGDLADYRAELRRHWGTFAVAGPVALFLLATGGWLLAGQALRPVRVLTQVASGLTAQGLDRRVDAPGADREFQALIDVINGMLDRLEKSFLQAARFSADAAHELKTPLTILQGQLEQAVQRAPAASQEQRTYADLLEEVQRLKGIVRKLLLLAQSDSGQLRLSLEPVCLNDEVAALFEDLPLVAPGLTLRQEFAPDVRVQADPDLLRQVLQNLFNNAYKYNREGGEIACALRHEGGRAMLTIANTTDPELHLDRERLFDRFYRGDRSRNRQVDGTGLGLSLAREIARAHGGDLVADPPQDGRVTFRLTLPMQTV